MKHDPSHDPKVPRGVLIAAGALMLVSIGLAAWGRSTQVAAQDPAAQDAPAESVRLRFADRDDGAVRVLGEDGREIAVLAPEEHGFVRGVARGMYRTRRLESLPPDAPFELARMPDGAFVLRDPETGHRVELRSFGQDNYASFAQLLEAAR